MVKVESLPIQLFRIASCCRCLFIVRMALEPPPNRPGFKIRALNPTPAEAQSRSTRTRSRSIPGMMRSAWAAMLLSQGIIGTQGRSAVRHEISDSFICPQHLLVPDVRNPSPQAQVPRAFRLHIPAEEARQARCGERPGKALQFLHADHQKPWRATSQVWKLSKTFSERY